MECDLCEIFTERGEVCVWCDGTGWIDGPSQEELDLEASFNPFPDNYGGDPEIQEYPWD